jgi:hypothetical protein
MRSLGTLSQFMNLFILEIWEYFNVTLHVKIIKINFPLIKYNKFPVIPTYDVIKFEKFQLPH